MTVGIVTATPSLALAPVMTPKMQALVMTPKAYAKMEVIRHWNSQNQYVCLARLWGKESAWNPKAYNPISVGGRHAGGIPQILGLNPKLPHTTQIDLGIKYIKHRYKNPCRAWAFWLSKDKKGVGWY